MQKTNIMKKLAMCVLILTMAAGGLQLTAFAEEQTEASQAYNSDWNINMDTFGITFHLSEEDYSLFVKGATEKSQISLERMGWTSEEIENILTNNNALMEVFPITARSDYTEYVVFAFNWGTYDAQGKNLEQLYQDPEAAEAFRQYVYDHSNEAILPTFVDEGVQKIGDGTWQKYSYSVENDGMYMGYVTVLRDSILWMELKYWDEELTADMHTVMEDILGKATYVIRVSLPDLDLSGLDKIAKETADDLFDIDTLTDDLLDKLDLPWRDSAQDTVYSYDCIHEFPFYTSKELVRQALEDRNLEIFNGTSPVSDELYVFRDYNDDSTWQSIYEFDQNERLVSVTMPLIAEGTAEAFTGPFLRAKAYYQSKLGDYEVNDKEALQLVQTDPEAFMDSLSSEKTVLRLSWKDAFDCEGSELYMMFMELNGNPSVFVVYYSPETAPGGGN